MMHENLTQGILALCLSFGLASTAASAQGLASVCVSWGGPFDGTETVIYHKDGSGEQILASYLDAPSGPTRRWLGTAPDGTFERLVENLIPRLASLDRNEPSAESCEAGDWRWVIAATFDDGQVIRAEGACFDGPTERLYRDVIDWTDLLDVRHDGGDGEDLGPVTAAHHSICQGTQ